MFHKCPLADFLLTSYWAEQSHEHSGLQEWLKKSEKKERELHDLLRPRLIQSLGQDSSLSDQNAGFINKEVKQNGYWLYTNNVCHTDTTHSVSNNKIIFKKFLHDL